MKSYPPHRRAIAALLAIFIGLMAGCSENAESSVAPPPASVEQALSSSSVASSSKASSVPPSSSTVSEPPPESVEPPVSSEPEPPPEPVATRDNTPYVRTPVASGTTVLGNSSVTIDASNTSQGYIMVQYTGSSSKVKLQITCNGGTTYTYDLHSGGYETFPLTAGSGSYAINVFENVSGDQYAQACGTSTEVSLANSLVPFLYPNQFVDFHSGSATVAKGSELAGGAQTDLQVVENVYNWTISHISYDFDKANAVAAGGMSGYLPSVDSIINSGLGICFDYAAVMVTMLRSQRIPTKLVVGYAGDIYHAWINVYITDVGWVKGVIKFDGASWVRMDPTFASSGNSSSDIMAYIGNGSNYNEMLVY